ncbi:MAG: VCBS repeat-containing protein, partial [Candidatus Poseidoniaceae archaeon]|nr:VCBS repeat-containing protein [Candidatus Poseidoniaceae archaeon]
LNAAILLTTIDANNGNMWVWRIDGESGSLDWERISLTGTQTDADPVHLRVPGPVIAQLDEDAAPEVVFTIPSDQNGRTNGNGATFVAWDLTSTNELWRFRAPNGYADAAPIAVDEDDDGTSDRLCWVTWYSTSSLTFERQGLTGCHDITEEPISKIFSRTMDSSSGNDNDEIAASAPLAIDIDGTGAPELVVGFGRRVYAFNGDSGTSADINTHWASPLSIPHRTWSAPAAGDLDGDGALDLLIGDTVVSRTAADAAPTSDSRGISFNPEQPDPGVTVTISAQYSNIGTSAFDGAFDAVLYLGGVEIGRDRSIDLEPVAPSGNGGPVTFSVDMV